MKDEISLKAKIARDVIRMATSVHFIGEGIQKGIFRRNLIEPEWRTPDGFHMMKMKIKHFEMEFLTPPNVSSNMVILQLHGGGYIGKMRNVYRDFACEYSGMQGGMKVLTIDYRVAPQHPFPAALEDAVAAYEWLLRIGYLGSEIIVAGDSAGGGLALALCAWLRDNGRELPAGMVLMSPWTDLTASGSSYDDNYEKDPLFGNTRESMIYSGEYPADNNPQNPYISPLFDTFDKFPPMLFQVGSIEMLLSDSVDAANKARSAGCNVKITIYDGMFHVFQMGLRHMKESEQAWDEVAQFVEGLSKRYA